MNQSLDPEIEKILQDLKRLNGGLVALQDRVIRYIATKESQAR